jgi:ATP-dependent DNA helicase RecQ
MAAIRFPTEEDIREVYQAVANYLQMPIHAGQGQYHDFDISDFLKKFNLTGHTVVYALKALEQDGWLSFNEQVFLPATIRFTISKEALYEFEKEHAQLEPCIKTLLRSYEGIYDQYTPISEKLIGSLMRKEADEVKQQLLQLHQQQVIEYQPQKDSPQLYFLRQRIKAEDIHLNMEAYNQRKEQFQQRMKQMVQYVKAGADCRSRTIGNYFGDADIKNCGICDNCLKQKATPLTKEEFDNIHQQIISTLANGSVEIKQLVTKLTGIKKEKVWKVLDFLQAENIIMTDARGKVRLK